MNLTSMFLHLNLTGFFRVNILLVHRHILPLPERVIGRSGAGGDDSDGHFCVP